MSQLIIPAEPAQVEIRVSNSRFFTTIAPVFSVKEAREFVDHIKAEFADATHNVSAFIIGHGSSVIAHCTDDGEPSGTAGRPALAVLQGSGMGDVVVVVTRYFGGIKLGTGGLVRAYGDAVRRALEVVPRAEKVSTNTIRMAVPYNLLEGSRSLVVAHQGRILTEEFAAEVTMTAQLRASSVVPFQKAIQELSHGRIAIQIVDTNEETILPLNKNAD